MAFQYYDEPRISGPQANPYVVETPQSQQQQQGIPQGPGLQGLKELFGLGGAGEAVGGVAGQGTGTAAGGGAMGGGVAGGGELGAMLGGSGGATGASGAGSAGGGGSAFASAGPWAALAAAVIANEYSANEAGRRPENESQWARDALTGKVTTYDAPYLTQKVFGKDQFGFGGDIIGGAELSTGDFSNAWEAFKEQGTIGKIGKALTFWS